jgi:hypothetical protein
MPTIVEKQEVLNGRGQVSDMALELQPARTSIKKRSQENVDTRLAASQKQPPLKKPYKQL